MNYFCKIGEQFFIHRPFGLHFIGAVHTCHNDDYQERGKLRRNRNNCCVWREVVSVSGGRGMVSREERGFVGQEGLVKVISICAFIPFPTYRRDSLASPRQPRMELGESWSSLVEWYEHADARVDNIRGHFMIVNNVFYCRLRFLFDRMGN